MPVELTESAAINRFRFDRWPDTGFRCRVCQHEHGRQLSTRPRVFRCARRGCGKQTSVTAGTLAHGTKLGLLQWEKRGEMHEAPRTNLPSVREVAHELGVSVSTAWLLNQKFAAVVSVLQSGIRDYAMLGLIVPVALRRPRTGQLGEQRLELEALQVPEAQLCLPDHGPGFTMSLLRAGEHEIPRNAWVLPVDYIHHDVAGWLQSRLEGVHKKVSLRWLPRWVDAYLHVYNTTVLDRRCEKLRWRALVQCVHRRPLRLLDPWLAPRPPPGPPEGWLTGSGVAPAPRGPPSGSRRT
ncbi:MAG: hypothetical protein R3F59_34790 [Myxococcota bacterium]